jgi:hypothetical protein
MVPSLKLNYMPPKAFSSKHLRLAQLVRLGYERTSFEGNASAALFEHDTSKNELLTEFNRGNRF